jgi:2-amino-4-hydroxy-6-hydroxymethyldihydropteridine diphosphokinase
MNKVYLGIGGNLGNRLENITKTIQLIEELICKPTRISSIYLSEPWGFVHAKYFTNAVLLLETDISLRELFNISMQIEKKMKRERSVSGYQGRTMDIDILFYGNMAIADQDLIIPHPKVQNRLFVLLPLFEISPQFAHPTLNISITEMIKRCSDTGKIRKINYGT